MLATEAGAAPAAVGDGVPFIVHSHVGLALPAVLARACVAMLEANLRPLLGDALDMREKSQELIHEATQAVVLSDPATAAVMAFTSYRLVREETLKVGVCVIRYVECA